MIDKQSFYLERKSEEIAQDEVKYDVFTHEKQKHTLSPAFFLKKMREIVFCRKKRLPTKQKEKQLREYRDYDIASR